MRCDSQLFEVEEIVCASQGRIRKMIIRGSEEAYKRSVHIAAVYFKTREVVVRL